METIAGKLVTNNSKHAGIYAIINLRNNKFYIGSTNNLYVRKKGHFNDLKGNRHKNKHLQNAYNKDSDFFIMVEIETINYLDILRDREQFWLDELKCFDNKIGYNINKFADGVTGYTHTLETREKLRKAHLGRKLPEEQKRNISKSGKGRIVSEETRKKISESNRRTKSSSNYKSKRNEKATKVVQMDIDGNVIQVWDRIKEAATSLGVHSSNIVHCCKGIKKTTGGFKWAYYN